MEIKYSNQKPPNWLQILKHFPGARWEDGIIVTYGDTYYCKEQISLDLVAHESTHMRQQQAFEFGIDGWWNRYYGDKVFRLEQEVEAYRNQVAYLREHPETTTRNQRRDGIKRMAQALSSSIYGSIIGYEDALNLIK